MQAGISKSLSWITVYLQDHGADASPTIHLEWMKGMSEYLIGELKARQIGKHYDLVVTSTRRKTSIGTAVLLPDGSYGVYINHQLFAGLGNKAELIVELRKRLVAMSF